MNTILALATTLVAAQSTPRIEDYVQRNLRDATLVARVLKGDQRELKKINGDFGQAYRFDTTTVQIKEPFKLRLEANVEDSNVIYIINGPRRLLKIPKSGISQSKDLSMHPGQRQTLMDFGLLTPSLFEDLFQSKFVRTDRATGDLVFDLTYPASMDDTSRQRVWVDKEKKLVDKRVVLASAQRGRCAFQCFT